MSKKQVKKMILVGILEREEGILCIKNQRTGLLGLPGGVVNRSTKHRDRDKQIKKERRRLEKILRVKCGLSVRIKHTQGIYTINNRIYKVYILERIGISSVPERKKLYETNYLNADWEIISKYYPNLSRTDKFFLFEYFRFFPKRNKQTGLLCVKKIAS